MMIPARWLLWPVVLANLLCFGFFASMFAEAAILATYFDPARVSVNLVLVILFAINFIVSADRALGS